jgi:glyoxylase-like metal-dependent hydrolase (beta-lactamase superfamily II)
MIMKVKIHTIRLGPVNCYLLQAEKSILIDAGMTCQKGRLLRQLRKTGVPFTNIEMTLITHGHIDHIGNTFWAREKIGSKIAIHYKERDWLERGYSPIPPGRTRFGKLVHVIGKLSPEISAKPTKVDILIPDEGLLLREYGIPGKVIHTPGHSRGSTCVLLETGEAFVGDLLTGPRFWRRSPGLSFFAEDVDLLLESLRSLIGMGVETIYPAHGKPFVSEELQEKFKGWNW